MKKQKQNSDWVLAVLLLGNLALFGFLIVYAQITNARMDRWATEHGYTVRQVGFGEITNGYASSR